MALNFRKVFSDNKKQQDKQTTSQFRAFSITIVNKLKISEHFLSSFQVRHSQTHPVLL